MRLYILLFTAVCAVNLLQGSGSTFYADFEHPNLTYWNPKYYAHLNVTARRRGRRDPIHYVSAHSECLTDFGNEILVDVYLYEFRSNEYRRGFMEVHYRLCEWLDKERTFMPYVIKFLPIKTCPFPKGEYHFVDMSLPDVPLLRTFPFSKGRFFLNVSNHETAERVLQFHIYVVIKERTQRIK